MTGRTTILAVIGVCIVVSIAPTPTAGGIASFVAAVVAATSCWRAHRRARPRSSAPWLLMAFALAASSLGELLFTWLQWRGSSPFPSVADVCYLALYPLMAVALLVIAKRRVSTGHGNAALDTVMVTVAASAVAWALIIQPSSGDTTASLVARILAVAYPVGDLLMLAAVTRLALGGGLRNAAIRWIGIGILSMLVADLGFSLVSVQGIALDDRLTTVAFILSYGCFALAAQHSDAESAAEPAESVTKEQSVGRLAALVACALSVPITLWAHAIGDGSDRVTLAVLSVSTVATFTLVAVGAWSLGRVVTSETVRRFDARFSALVRNANDIILILDEDLVPTYVSPAGERLWGQPTLELCRYDFVELLDPRSVDDAGAALDACAADGGSASFEVRVARRGPDDTDARTLDALVVDQRDDPAVGGLVITMRDVTERRRLDEQLAHQAFHDALTGLSNRALFRDRLTNALARTLRVAGHDVTVMFLDLDGFKSVNDTHGHRAGDALLVRIAQRIEECLRLGDTAARFGGDEFAVLLENATDDQVERVAQRLLRALQEPIRIDGHAVEVSASIGIARAATEEDPEAVLHHADLAMFDAKGAGKNCVRRFDAEVNDAREARERLRTDLDEAITSGQLHLAFQPIMSIDDATVVGVEALLRWSHPEHGEISPVDFIPLAEESGAIIEIGRWVVEQACREAVTWPGDVYVSVNISGVQLDRDDLVGHIAGTLAATGLEPARLMLELTESSIIRDSGPAVTALRALDRLGVLLAIDDFGTGYSSLAYLHQLPVDHLKIDRRFVDQVHTPSGATLARSIVLIAASMSITAIAEGIETEQQRDLLAAMGCTLGQGYWWSRPIAAGDLRRLLGDVAVSGAVTLPSDVAA